MLQRCSKMHYLALVILLALLVVLRFLIREHLGLVAGWWLTMALLGAFVLVVGHGVTGMWRGVLIDERNVISLSRFQMLAWTVLILSAFMAAAFWNIASATVATPLDQIKLDPTLWMLMGISTTSLVASPLILSGKKAQMPAAGEVQRTFALLDASGSTDPASQGLVVTNRTIAQAAWTDMFTGEETSNAAHVDLSRVQMFFFTLVALLAYGSLIGRLFATAATGSDGVGAFPAVPEGLLALIGISHGGYLTLKAMPISQRAAGASDTTSPAAAGGDQPAVG